MFVVTYHLVFFCSSNQNDMLLGNIVRRKLLPILMICDWHFENINLSKSNCHICGDFIFILLIVIDVVSVEDHMVIDIVGRGGHVCVSSHDISKPQHMR